MAIFAYLLLGNLKDSPERKLVSKFAGSGQPLDIVRTLAMALGGVALSSFVVIAMTTVSSGRNHPSPHASTHKLTAFSFMLYRVTLRALSFRFRPSRGSTTLRTRPSFRR